MYAHNSTYIKIKIKIFIFVYLFNLYVIRRDYTYSLTVTNPCDSNLFSPGTNQKFFSSEKYIKVSEKYIKDSEKYITFYL